MPHNLSQAASNVATDAYNSAYNLGGPRITYLSVLDAASGTLKRGTFLLTREGGASGKGNSRSRRNTIVPQCLVLGTQYSVLRT